MQRLLVSIWLLSFGASVQGAETDVDYLREIKPLLREHCYTCHGALKQQAGLRLDTGAAIRQGASAGPVIETDDPEHSLLLEVVRGTGDLKMPPAGEGRELTPAQIDLLAAWIRQGAQTPDDEEPDVDPATYWSYQAIARPAVPAVRDAAWSHNPIDAFIAAEHEKRGLQPRPEADRATWLRRVTLDLIGVPPTRAELQAFLADDSPDAFEKVVDGLLARPQYGERWGRHWMDIWRYSDWYGSRGINQIRYSQRHIWRWRDWIIDSLNADKGYNQMVLEMLAGDELAPNDPDVLRATGFLGRNWYKFDRNVWLFETTEQTAQAFLGVTMKCARCHDHKYDPLPQLDYYRFRAFFEPHQVRTDAITENLATEKDSASGDVLQEGLSRVYDQELEAPTYLFRRGDDRQADKSQPLTPGVPAALQGPPLEIAAVALPVESYYQSLRDVQIAGLLKQAQDKIDQADQAVKTSIDEVALARQNVAERKAAAAISTESEQPPYLQDDFSQARDDVWQVSSGQWVYENGHLVEKQVANFATLVTRQQHPPDFTVKVKYRTLEPGSYRSVGFSYDYADPGNSQDVYTSTNDARQSIQAFHRKGGQQVYPQAGIVPVMLKRGDVTTVEAEVRGSRLKLKLNGEHKLDYELPIPRQPGRFALWVHEGSAEFLELEIRPLMTSLETLEQTLQLAEQKLSLQELDRKLALAERETLQARIAAEKARYGLADADRASELALAASRSERELLVLQADREVLGLQQAHDLLPMSTSDADRQKAEQKLAEARNKLETARQAVDQADGKYAPLGDQYPSTSTGRRLALARWIASPENPRTARVAVNHLWARHFGEGLVSTVENFGLNGARPSHPDLLNWLAAELTDAGWKMKHIHRLIVLSRTYRTVSTVGDNAEANLQADPQNRYLWRMPSKRMEAEVVRDSLLYAAGSLDLTPGGPEIPETSGLQSPRRSLYFRNTPNEKMKLLELFDVADPNQCYRRRQSVVPQQALALLNSGLAIDQSRKLAESLSQGTENNDESFITAAFETILTRSPTETERAACVKFLQAQAALVQAGTGQKFAAGGEAQRAAAATPAQRARENLVQVLFSHNDFVTVR